jgi:hypothetical protein
MMCISLEVNRRFGEIHGFDLHGLTLSQVGNKHEGRSFPLSFRENFTSYSEEIFFPITPIKLGDRDKISAEAGLVLAQFSSFLYVKCLNLFATPSDTIAALLNSYIPFTLHSGSSQ